MNSYQMVLHRPVETAPENSVAHSPAPLFKELNRSVDRKTPRWGREFRVAISIGRTFIGMLFVVAVPRNRSELLIRPFGLYGRARPFVAKVIQHVDQAR